MEHKKAKPTYSYYHFGDVKLTSRSITHRVKGFPSCTSQLTQPEIAGYNRLDLLAYKIQEQGFDHNTFSREQCDFNNRLATCLPLDNANVAPHDAIVLLNAYREFITVELVQPPYIPVVEHSEHTLVSMGFTDEEDDDPVKVVRIRGANGSTCGLMIRVEEA